MGEDKALNYHKNCLYLIFILIFVLIYVKIGLDKALQRMRMNEKLLQKISTVSEEEERILSGRTLEKDLYCELDDFVVSSERMTGPSRDISVRTHTRYTDFPLHRHNYLEMMIVLSGHITHRIAGEAVTLGRGDIIVLNKHVTHSIDKADTQDLGVNIIISDRFMDSIRGELAQTVFSELAEQNSRQDGSGIYLAFSTDANKQISNVIENLLYELHEDSSNAQIKKYTVALLFGYLSEHSESLLHIASRLPDRNGMRKATILGYLDMNYKTATLSELSSLVYLSVPYLSKIINEYFGKSFKALLRDTRIRKACELIVKTSLPIGEIISSVGYENESYFHREFKQKTGKTPLEMRKSVLKPS